MNRKVRPKAVLLPILIVVFFFSLIYLSYLQQYNQRIYILNIEIERTSRLLYEMTKEMESQNELERFINPQNFFYYKTKHFDIYCQNDLLAQYLRDNIEIIYEKITQALGYMSVDLEYRASRKIKIVIFKEVTEYRKLTESPFPWSIGNAVYLTNSFYSYEGEHLRGLIPHELTHLLFYRFLRGSYNLGAMRWLSEGVAMYGEAHIYKGFVNKALVPKLKSARDGEYILLKDLIKSTDLQKEDLHRVQLWYAECLSLVTFMIQEGGKEKFKEFCLVLSKERRIENALEKVYQEEFSTVEKLEQKWLKYLKTHRLKW